MGDWMCGYRRPKSKRRQSKHVFEPSRAPSARKGVFENANGVPLVGGKTMHLDVRAGELANRLLTVGSRQRAEAISEFMDVSPPPFVHVSSRGFTTITGTYKGTQVSVVAIGMGYPMMDFFVREARAVVDGPMGIIRFGTCGTMRADVDPGSVVVASEGSTFVQSNPSAILGVGEDRNPFVMHPVMPADEQMSACLLKHLRDAIPEGSDVKGGLNVTADSFYSSQGRSDPNFDDDNEEVLERVVEKFPNATTMEMETYQLLHLAARSKGSIKATACHIVIFNRTNGQATTHEKIQELERLGGRAVLDCLVAMEL